MMSSMRLRNSGRKCPFSTFISDSRNAFSGKRLSSGCPRLSMMIDAPRLLVAMMMVLLKSTTRPLPSVSRPSSNTCSSTLLTSG
ncbi:hypothetical protein D3C81_2110810 [compost metagenome]